MNKRIHISIPKPCYENWDTMAPADRGRFCMACQKQVIDFTKASDREIMAAMQQDKNLCGRFRNTQLDRELVVPKKKKGYSILAGFTFLSLLLPAMQKVMAQGKPMVITEKDNNKRVADSTETEPTSISRIIKGTILDEEGLSVPQTTIKNLTIGKQTISDFDGSFSLEATKGDEIEFSSIGFKIVKLKISTENIPLNIQFKQEYEMSSGIIVYSKRPSFFKRIYYKIRNLFR